MHFAEDISEPAAWVTQAGIAGAPEPKLLAGFCERVLAEGIPITRARILIDTLHPIHEGRAFSWRADRDEQVIEYGRTSEDEVLAEKWRQSPFFWLDQTGEPMLRRRLVDNRTPEFPLLAELSTDGQTDYLAFAHRFTGEEIIGAMDCVYSSWSTDAPSGFSDEQILTLSRSLPSFALAIKCASLARIAVTVVETYLGPDAGRRVLKGGIIRGIADRIDAVIWFSDLRGFTRITDGTAPEQVIPLLNDYAEAVISAIHGTGGEVLKLIGDGTLAIFRADEPEIACRRALEAEASMRERVEAVNRRRMEQHLPVTTTSLGLHIGEVFYGNVGSSDRLDFTVVGPAVNEASRIAAMCRSVERSVLFSSAFTEAALNEDRARFVSVGRYALRGVIEPQQLFTLDRGSALF
jgi:adenylate cyclase